MSRFSLVIQNNYITQIFLENKPRSLKLITDERIQDKIAMVKDRLRIMANNNLEYSGEITDHNYMDFMHSTKCLLFNTIGSMGYLI